MKNLKKVSKAIVQQEKNNTHIFNYVIPKLWDTSDVPLEEKISVNDQLVIVNPYHYFEALIDQVILKQQPPKTHQDNTHGDWIKDAFVYSMMIRASASYDHDRSGTLETSNMYGLKETGTFLKALAYLPTLKKMGINVLYLLPISKYSRKNKKGELGSPYGISNFFELDEGLSDPLVGDLPIEIQFKALVEACHIFGIKVIIDIIPRTNSVNSDYIKDHPEWFYWISSEDLSDYKPPMVTTLNHGLPAKEEYFKELFESEEVIAHIKKFTKNPKETDPKLWDKVLEIHKKNPNMDFNELIESQFGLTVAPAFSDRINDPQPAWSDITFFRLYLDHPTTSTKYFKAIEEASPYILYDVAKASYNPGNKINQSLWDTIVDIIPTYIKEYGIDGARIDMGHALPNPLVTSIIEKAREADPNFAFIAEELDVENAAVSLEKGYNMIIGDGFIRLPRVKEGMFNSFVYGAINLEAPMFAVGETHDSPRLSAREGNDDLNEMITLYNLFIPNTIPFLNSGQELFEKQPMNTGLDCRVNEAFLLDEDDPMYGKLALFDRVSFGYTHPRAPKLIEKLHQLQPIRARYLESMQDDKKTYPLGFSAPWVRAAGIAYVKDDTCLLALVNTGFDKPITHTIKVDNLPECFIDGDIHLLFSSKNKTHQGTCIDENNIIYITFEPFEVVLIEIKAKSGK
jgi:glycosidase